jgi:hypothetical protein
MTDRANPGMHSMETPGVNSTVDGLPVNSDAFELFERDEPVLSIRDLSDFAVPSPPTPPMGR